ncbi:ssk1 response regulator receiver [Ceratobasidium sp. 414]|nr:ssk1 response regulator receiver [Ceratobasidium sp. 414]
MLSVGAMLTAMKAQNRMSARPPGFVEAENTSPESVMEEDKSDEMFDVGELLQNMGDVLAGIAAQAGTYVVIYHADVTLKHVGVKGEEGGVSYVLSHIVRQIIAIAESGGTIELGLNLDAQNGDSSACIFDIIHRLDTLDPLDHLSLSSGYLPNSTLSSFAGCLPIFVLRSKSDSSRCHLLPLAATTTPTPPMSLPAPPPALAYTLSIPFKSAPLPMTPPELGPADEAERQPSPRSSLLGSRHWRS